MTRRALLCQKEQPAREIVGRELTCAIVCATNDEGEREAPSTIMLVPQGDSKGLVRARDGRIFKVDRDAMISATKEDGIDLMLDRDHESFFSMRAVPAAGWIVASSIRKNGRGKHAAVVADVLWTDEGRADVESLRFRFISPAFDPRGATVDEVKGEFILNVNRLENAGIVNQPALKMPALASKEHSTMDLTKLLFALGLDPETSFEDALAHIKASKTELLTSEDSIPVSQYNELATRFATVKGERDTLANAAKATAAATLVADALRAEKILPAEQEAMLELASSNPTSFKKIVDVRPAGMFSKVETETAKQPKSAPAGANGLTDDERFVCGKLGMTEADYLAQKQANAGQTAQA